MIPDWKRKKLTFLMIPEEANQKVRRLQAPLIWVYAACTALLLLITAATVILTVQGAALKSNEALKADLKLDRIKYEQMTADKDNEIARLKEEIVMLSEQAEEFSVKLEQLRMLEREILSLSDEEHTASLTSSAAESIDPREVSVFSTAAESGVGGQYEPVVSTEDTLSLSKHVRLSLTEMGTEAGQLVDSLTEALAEAERIAILRSRIPSIHPTVSTRVTSSFGFRRDPFTRRTARHQGIDFGGDVGDPIFSTAAGHVSRTGYDRAMGNYVFIEHGNGLETVYMHLNKSLVTKGQTVKKGEKIGQLGSTGRSTGPHLHYEIHKNGTPVNPKPYLKARKG